MLPSTLFLLSLCITLAASQCTDNSTDTAGLQELITNGGEGYVLSLCAGQVYAIEQPLNFTSSGQEISTESYPTDSSRATLFINGSREDTAERVAHTIAIQGICNNCSDVRVRNIQIDGNRGDNPITTGGGANMYLGGPNSGQVVEYVRSFDPRGWSCLHVAEGPFTCSNATIANNDIGPCGSDYYGYWSDGISLGCANSLVENNTINDATDGGIVIFGAPGSTIRNNTISATDRVMLGGINMVDYSPWNGNYSNVLVEGNRINGGFADSYGNTSYGVANSSALIKIGTGIGPLVWWGDERYGTNSSAGPASLRNNEYSGAMVFAIAIAGALDFELVGNRVVGNATFSGAYAVNCTTGADTPHPPTPYLLDPTSNSTNLTIDNIFDYQTGSAGGLVCFSVMDVPPLDAYPYGPAFNWTTLTQPVTSEVLGTATSTGSATGTGTRTGASASATQTGGAERLLPSGLLVVMAGMVGLLLR